MFENFDNGKWGARKDGFLPIERGVEEADILIHVEDVFVG